MTPEQEHARWSQITAGLAARRARFTIFRKPAASAITTLTPAAPAPKPAAAALPPLPAVAPTITAVHTEPSTWPLWARGLKKLASPGDAGIGDVIHTQLGIHGRAFVATMALLRVPCRCDARRIQYNAQFPIERK
jgi:hypothetical protein